jgi:hypothetical protein
VSAAIDVGVTADSNINHATDLPSVLVDYGEGPVAVPLGAEARRRSGVGLYVGGSASADLRLGRGASLAADAQAYLVDYEGGSNDDASFELAGGPELQLAGGGLASVQLVGFRRTYGGLVAAEGLGARSALLLPFATGRAIRLLAEAREFSSAYGEDFEGSFASGTASLEAALGPQMAGTAGLYVRRYWLGSASNSSSEVGIYAALTRYLGQHLSGALSAGISRAWFDEPTPWLSPEKRHDWRLHGSLSARTRRPLLHILHPYLTYSFGRTDSSILFYDADRHLLRLGVVAPF